jgi:malonyl CoA-acyl carrier protein transacylase
MGRELLARYRIFEQSVTEAGAYLDSIGCSWDPISRFNFIRLFISTTIMVSNIRSSAELLKNKDETNINNAEYSQALCTVLQVALVDLLEYIGVHPAALVGHSSGEIAAA